MKAHTFIINKSLIGNDSNFQTQIALGPWMYDSAHKQVFLTERVNQATVAKPYFGLNGLSIILCLWSPLHLLSKLLVIQDCAQNLQEQLWMVGRSGRAVLYLTDLWLAVIRSIFSLEHLYIFATGVEYQQNVGRLLYPASRGYIFAVWVKCVVVSLFTRQLAPWKCWLCLQIGNYRKSPTIKFC